MKELRTIDDCFKDAKAQYLKMNPFVIENIQEEAFYLAEIFMITREQYINYEVQKAFEKHLSKMNGDSVVRVIESTTSDASERLRLLQEYYMRATESGGYSLQEFIILNE